MADRPVNLAWPYINAGHQLAQGLVFAGLGPHPGGLNFHDCSPHRNHGTLTNMDPATDWVWDSYLRRWVMDHLTDDYIHNTFPIVTGPPFTISCWFNSGSNSTVQCLCSIANNASATQNWRLHLRGDVAGDPVRFGAQDGDLSEATITGYVINKWHHAVGVEFSNILRAVYLDGVRGTDETTDRTPSGVNCMDIGRAGDSTPDGYMSGRIADLMIWNRVLSAAEITCLANPAWSVMMGGLILPPRRETFPAAAAPPAGAVMNQFQRQNLGADLFDGIILVA